MPGCEHFLLDRGEACCLKVLKAQVPKHWQLRHQKSIGFFLLGA